MASDQIRRSRIGDREMLDRVETLEIRQLLEQSDDSMVPIASKKDDNGQPIWTNGDKDFIGYLGVVLKWAFMKLRTNGENFETALINVITRGGDTDTNEAITGALISAYIGASRIPEIWRKTHERKTETRELSMRQDGRRRAFGQGFVENKAAVGLRRKSRNRNDDRLMESDFTE